MINDWSAIFLLLLGEGEGGAVRGELVMIFISQERVKNGESKE